MKTEDYKTEDRREEQDLSTGLTAQLLSTAHKIDALRKATGKSQNAWTREWPGLGSQKTYGKILAGELDDVSVAKKLPDYRAVLAAITANVSRTAAEELYEDLPGAQAVTLASLRLMHHDGKDRMILVLGGSGSGKTSALEVLAAQGAGGSRMHLAEADETWKSPRAALRRLLILVGTPKAQVPNSTADMEDMLIGRITEQGKCTIAIDEAHHVSGCVLNIFKTLLNRTQLRLILAGMSTLFQKLRASASEEAKQLIHNRLFERVELAGPAPDTARMFLARRLRLEAPEWKDGTLREICAMAANCGHWSFIRRVVDQLRNSGVTDPGDTDLIRAADSARREIA